MRVNAALFLGVILLGAAPAAAQAQWVDPYTAHQLGVLEAEQRMARDRAVALENRLNAQIAQGEAERAVGQLRQQAAPVWLPSIRPRDPAAVAEAGASDTAAFPQIPPERLARSNARVLAITGARP